MIPETNEKISENGLSSGDAIAAKIVSDMVIPIGDIGLNDIENICRKAMEANGNEYPSKQRRSGNKSKDKSTKGMEIFPKLNSYNINQQKNHMMRFSLEGMDSQQPKGWAGFFSGHADTSTRDYEDVLDVNILNAPITNVSVVLSNEAVRDGYYRLFKTPSNKKANLNSNSGGNAIYLCIKKDVSGKEVPITNFMVIFPDRGEFVPPGYFLVQRGNKPCNINTGTSAERIYLCFKKDIAGNPITDVQLIFPTKGENPPTNFFQLDKSQGGFNANLNQGTGGVDAYLCYRQMLTRLDCLRFGVLTAKDEVLMTPVPDVPILSPKAQRKHSLYQRTKSLDCIGLDMMGNKPFVASNIADHGAMKSSVSQASSPLLTENVDEGAISNTKIFRFSYDDERVGRSQSAESIPQIYSMDAADLQSNGGAESLPPSTRNSKNYEETLRALTPVSKHMFIQNELTSSVSVHEDYDGTPQLSNEIPLINNDDSPITKVHSLEIDGGASPDSLKPSAVFSTSPEIETKAVTDTASDRTASKLSARSISSEQVDCVAGTDIGTEEGTEDGSVDGESVKAYEDSSIQPLRKRAETAYPVDSLLAVGELEDNDDVDGDDEDVDVDQTYPNVGRNSLAMAMRGDSMQLTRGSVTVKDVTAEEAVISSNRKVKAVVDPMGSVVPVTSRTCLHALLSVLYVRRGNIHSMALEGLMRLLKETNFFEMDCKQAPIPGTTTMMDVVIEAVNDRLEISSQQDNTAIQELLLQIIVSTQAKLSSFSLQRMFRGISFLCHSYATRPNWVSSGHSMPCAEGSEDFYEYNVNWGTGSDRQAHNSGVTPYKLLQQLLWDVLAQAELTNLACSLPESHEYGPDDVYSDLIDCTEVYVDVRLMVEDLIEDIIDSVELARMCRQVNLTVSKQSLTTSSSTFWLSINTHSKRFFVDPAYRRAFFLLCAICKEAWHGIRTNSTTGEAIPRDLGAKLIALEAITEFCLSAGEKVRMSKVMGYLVRRLVVSCVLYNVNYALSDHRIFRKLMNIISALWKVWRHAVRIEFAIVCEELVFKVLQANLNEIQPIYQMIMITEVVTWFDQPQLLLEMFVNYDMDRKFVSHWNTFSYLIRTLCAIARRILQVPTPGSRKSLTSTPREHRQSSTSLLGHNAEADKSELITTIRDVYQHALEHVCRTAKTLMDASGHAHLIQQDAAFRSRSLGDTAGWGEDDNEKSSEATSTISPPTETPKPSVQDPSSLVSVDINEGTANNNHGNHSGGEGSPNHRKRVGSIRYRRAAHEESENLINEAIKIYTQKSSLQKAVKYLISKNFMPDTPQEIANFLRVYKNSFDPSAIGDFLGEGGITPEQVEYWSQIRLRYTRAVSFVEMDLEPALRLYLTGCGFRLPGEAQKIDRFVEVFVTAFWQDNSGTLHCPFRKQDTVHLLSFAVIMLNTDLHRANIDAKKTGRKSQKMTKDQFINNLRGVDDKHDINRDYLSKIYDNIAATPIEMSVGVVASEGEGITLNTGENNVMTSLLSPEARAAKEGAFKKEICRSLRDSEDLLRSLAPYSYRFQLTGVDTKLSLDLVSFMYESVWIHFHAVAESLLTCHNHEVTMSAKIAALDILCYSLTSAIFLDLKVERMSLATLLKTFKDNCDKSPAASLTNKDFVPDNSWYEDVELGNPHNAMETISKVHLLMVYIKDTMQHAATYELTLQIAARFEKKAKIMENNTFFKRQGELQKVNRTGRSVTYNFFLFSDYLIYAHLSKNEYKVHEQLSLNAMNVQPVDNDPNFSSFFISHPIKSFVVVTDSPQSKQEWMLDIVQAINDCKKREIAAAESGPMGKRMSILGRLEGQQSQLVLQKSVKINFSPERQIKRAATVRMKRSATTDPGDDPSDDHDAHGHEPDSVHQAVPFSETVPIGSENSVGSPHHSPDERSAVSDLDKESVSSGSEIRRMPTMEERQQEIQESVVKFTSIVMQIDTDTLETLFQAGVSLWRSIMNPHSSISGGSIQDHGTKVKLFGLYKYAKFGPKNIDMMALVVSRPSLTLGSGNNLGEMLATSADNADINSRENRNVSRSNSMDPTSADSAAAAIFKHNNSTSSNAPTDGESISSGASTPVTSQSAHLTKDELQAWIDSSKSYSPEEAKREFVLTLFSAAPHWKYEQYLPQNRTSSS